MTESVILRNSFGSVAKYNLSLGNFKFGSATVCRARSRANAATWREKPKPRSGVRPASVHSTSKIMGKWAKVYRGPDPNSDRVAVGVAYGLARPRGEENRTRNSIPPARGTNATEKFRQLPQFLHCRNFCVLRSMRFSESLPAEPTPCPLSMPCPARCCSPDSACRSATRRARRGPTTRKPRAPEARLVFARDRV